MPKHVFEPETAGILRAHSSERPEAAVDAARTELAPLLHCLHHRVLPAELGTLEWILVELLLNAALITQRNTQAASFGPNPVSIELILPEDGRGFDVRVGNAGKPTSADCAQLNRRFARYAETRREIEMERRQHTDPSGRVRIPGTLGGGGMALLECIRVAREKGWDFEYRIEEAPVERTVFRVAHSFNNANPIRASNLHWAEWLHTTVELQSGSERAGFSPGHQKIADAVIDHAAIGPGQRVLDVGTGTGLLALTIAARFGSRVEVIGVDIDEECLDRCRKRAAEKTLCNTTFLLGDAGRLPLESASVDAVVCRSVLCHILDRQPVFREWQRVLKPRGRFSFYEPVDRYETRFSELVDFSPLGELAVRLREAEERFHHSPTSSLMNFDEHDLRRLLEQTGFQVTGSKLTERARDYTMTAASARDWWHLDVGGSVTPGHASPYRQLNRYLPVAELDQCVDLFCARLDGKTITYHTRQLFMWGMSALLHGK